MMHAYMIRLQAIRLLLEKYEAKLGSADAFVMPKADLIKLIRMTQPKKRLQSGEDHQNA